MNYSERLSNVAILGAAGKMGSGILLLVITSYSIHYTKLYDNGLLSSGNLSCICCSPIHVAWL